MFPKLLLIKIEFHFAIQSNPRSTSLDQPINQCTIMKRTCALLLTVIVPSLHAFHPTTNPLVSIANNDRGPCTTKLDLYDNVEEAIAEAQYTCNDYGNESEPCKVAWDIVEELEAADSHKSDAAAAQAASWEEKQVNYLPLLEGMDVLSEKLERKLYDLYNLSKQLAEAGAGEEIERLVYASEEMLGLLESAKVKVQELKQ